MSQHTSTVVGMFKHDGTIKPDVLDSVMDRANTVLQNHNLPITLQTLSYSPDIPFAVQQRDAESMLLDWITDAEIGEFLFNLLYDLDGGMELLRKRFGDLLTDRRTEPTMTKAWVAFVESRRKLLVHLRWLNDIAVKRGRPGLADEDRQMIEE